MDDFFYDPQESLGFMTITVNRLMSACLRRKMREDGIDLTAEQWGILVLLWNHAGSTQEELAHVGCVDKSSMSRVLSLMEAKGLIIRRTDPADARVTLLSLTPAGKRVREEVREFLAGLFAGMLGHVAPAQREALLASLDMLRRCMDAVRADIAG